MIVPIHSLTSSIIQIFLFFDEKVQEKLNDPLNAIFRWFTHFSTTNIEMECWLSYPVTQEK
jgi:hypothetical protein